MLGIEECKGTMHNNEVPCLILLPTDQTLYTNINVSAVYELKLENDALKVRVSKWEKHETKVVKKPPNLTKITNNKHKIYK